MQTKLSSTNRITAISATVLKKYSIFLVVIALMIVGHLLHHNFLTTANLVNVARQLAVPAILAFGATILIIGGMLDLSAGSVLALAGVLAAQVYVSTGSLILAMLVGIAVGLACNVLNALMVATLRAPPFIATLAMMAMARGVALQYTQGRNVVMEPDSRFSMFGQGSFDLPWFGGETLISIPFPIIFLFIIFIITWYVLRHTRLGRSVYAIGGNEEAAKASGIDVMRSKYMAFMINGIFVGIAGVLFMSRINIGQPNGAEGYEFQALTAAVIGGTSFSGGVGTAPGTLAGAFIVRFLDNIMNLNGVGSHIQRIVRGLIIALAVIYDIWMKSRTSKRAIRNIENKETNTNDQTTVDTESKGGDNTPQ